MKVEALIPDARQQRVQSTLPDTAGFASVLNDLGAALEDAQHAEDAFASGGGDLQTAIYERARADVALSVATAAAQRTAQALVSILNMQV